MKHNSLFSFSKIFLGKLFFVLLMVSFCVSKVALCQQVELQIIDTKKQPLPIHTKIVILEKKLSFWPETVVGLKYIKSQNKFLQEKKIKILSHDKIINDSGLTNKAYTISDISKKMYLIYAFTPDKVLYYSSNTKGTAIFDTIKSGKMMVDSLNNFPYQRNDIIKTFFAQTNGKLRKNLVEIEKPTRLKDDESSSIINSQNSHHGDNNTRNNTNRLIRDIVILLLTAMVIFFIIFFVKKVRNMFLELLLNIEKVENFINNLLKQLQISPLLFFLKTVLLATIVIMLLLLMGALIAIPTNYGLDFAQRTISFTISTLILLFFITLVYRKKSIKTSQFSKITFKEIIKNSIMLLGLIIISHVPVYFVISYLLEIHPNINGSEYLQKMLYFTSILCMNFFIIIFLTWFLSHKYGFKIHDIVEIINDMVEIIKQPLLPSSLLIKLRYSRLTIIFLVCITILMYIEMLYILLGFFVAIKDTWKFMVAMNLFTIALLFSFIVIYILIQPFFWTKHFKSKIELFKPSSLSEK